MISCIVKGKSNDLSRSTILNNVTINFDKLPSSPRFLHVLTSVYADADRNVKEFHEGEKVKRRGEKEKKEKIFPMMFAARGIFSQIDFNLKTGGPLCNRGAASSNHCHDYIA